MAKQSILGDMGIWITGLIVMVFAVWFMAYCFQEQAREDRAAANRRAHFYTTIRTPIATYQDVRHIEWLGQDHLLIMTREGTYVEACGTFTIEETPAQVEGGP